MCTNRNGSRGSCAVLLCPTPSSSLLPCRAPPTPKEAHKRNERQVGQYNGSAATSCFWKRLPGQFQSLSNSLIWLWRQSSRPYPHPPSLKLGNGPFVLFCFRTRKIKCSHELISWEWSWQSHQEKGRELRRWKALAVTEVFITVGSNGMRWTQGKVTATGAFREN